MRLLIVEDEPALRETLARQFRSAGFVVDLAADGVDGEFSGNEYPIDIAVVDLGLPGKSGLEAIRAYNEDDCRSTWQLRELLEARRADAEAAFGPIPRPPVCPVSEPSRADC